MGTAAGRGGAVGNIPRGKVEAALLWAFEGRLGAFGKFLVGKLLCGG